MSLYRSVRAVTGASGTGAIDWDAVAEAAKASTDPGSLELSEAERSGYAADVREARDAVGAVGSVYLTIGANRTRVGKVEVAVSGRITIVDALTDVERDLRSGTRVLVVDRIDGGTVLVEPA